MKWRTRRFLAAALILSVGQISAQVVHLPDSLADSASVTRPVPFELFSTARADTARGVSHPRKSPGTAMLLSAILPGAGQFYNESYWKVPVVLGFGIYFISSWLDNNRRYEEYRDRYSADLATNPTGSVRLLAVREFYKDQRDSFTWYFVVLYFLNIADAYVDASLYDFTVGGDLSVRFLPGPPATGAQVSVRLKF